MKCYASDYCQKDKSSCTNRLLNRLQAMQVQEEQDDKS